MSVSTASNQFESPAAPSAADPNPASGGHHSTRIATRLTLIRERAGLTQSQLAEASGLSRATITLIESGNADPKMSTVHQLAKALGIKVTELVD